MIADFVMVVGIRVRIRYWIVVITFGGCRWLWVFVSYAILDRSNMNRCVVDGFWIMVVLSMVDGCL